MRESTSIQIFTADGWIGEAEDLGAARVAARQLANDGEALPIRVEHDGRLVATFDAEQGFRVHQKVTA